MLDSSAKVPDGLLTSNLKFPGDMYECMDITVPQVTWEGQIQPGFK